MAFSCLPYIVNNTGLARNQFPDINIGMIVPDATVKKVDKRGVYVKLTDKVTGFAGVSLIYMYYECPLLRSVSNPTCKNYQTREMSQVNVNYYSLYICLKCLDNCIMPGCYRCMQLCLTTIDYIDKKQ